MYNRNTPVHKVALRNFTLLILACHSEEESKYLRACQNHTKKTWIFQAPAAPAMKKLLFCWMRKDADAGGVDATWRISSSSLRMCARQDCFVFERPQVVFYCNFSCSRHVSKSANLIGRIVFEVLKKRTRGVFLNDAFTRGVFCVDVAHSHWRPLFSHEALNVAREIRPGVYGPLGCRFWCTQFSHKQVKRIGMFREHVKKGYRWCWFYRFLWQCKTVMVNLKSLIWQ